MAVTSPPASMLPSRGTYALLAGASAFFLAYGSLVPFEFESITLSEALARFAAAISWPPFIDSRTDFVTNILIAVPPAYFGMATLCTDRPWRTRGAGMVVVFLSCLALAVLVEFTQVFFPIRTDSLSDIVAQAIGAAAGVGAWMLLGESVTRWVRETLSEREPPALVQRLLLVYVVLFVISQAMPLDLTMNLGQLAQKYRAGGVLLVPFSYQYASDFDQAWDLLGTLVLSSPLGAAAVLVGTRRNHRRHWAVAALLAVVAVGLVECAQVLVVSRIADITDFIVGSIGAIIGVVIAGKLSARAAFAPARTAPRRGSLGWEAVFLWICALISYHWSPFDFTVNAERVADGARALTSVPFHSYYVGDQYHAFDEILRKGLLGIPLGIGLAFALPRALRSSRARLGMVAALAFGMLLVIEVGQIFVPSRTPDITDPLMGTIGALIGFLVTDRMRALSTPSIDRAKHIESAG